MEKGNHRLLLDQLEPILNELEFSRRTYRDGLLWANSLFVHTSGVYLEFTYDHLDQLTIIMFGRKWLCPDQITFSLSARYDFFVRHFEMEGIGVFYIDRSLDKSIHDYNNRFTKYLSSSLPIITKKLTLDSLIKVETEWMATINESSFRPRSWAEYANVEPILLN